MSAAPPMVSVPEPIFVTTALLVMSEVMMSPVPPTVKAPPEMAPNIVAALLGPVPAVLINAPMPLTP